MAPDLAIRPYDPADLDALIAIFRGAVRRVARRHYSEAQLRAWAPDVIDRALWAERRASRPTWVAVVAGAPVGFADLEPDGHLDMLFVDPDHQRRGIARALVETVEAEARAQGLRRIFTAASRRTARPFFEHAGFRVVAPQTVTIRGHALVNFRMEKRLD